MTLLVAPMFVLFAAAGSLLRAAAADRGNHPGAIPAGTFAVNAVGSFLLGLLTTTAPPWATLLGTAFLGSLTTFSTFVRELVDLAEAGHPRRAFNYAATSIVVGVAGGWTGIVIVCGT